MDDRFDFPEVRPGELTEPRRRLDREGFADRVRHQESLVPRRAQLSGQPFWKRAVSYLISLSRLTQTRRQADWVLPDEVAILRQATLGVAQEELAALTQDAATLADQILALADADARTRRNLAELEARTGQALVEEAGRREGLDRQRIDSERRLEERISTLQAELADARQELLFERATRQRAFSEFDRRLVLKAPAAGTEPFVAAEPPGPVGVQSLLDSFYFRLEARYRGSRQEIKQRLLVYRNDWRAARERTGSSGLVVDLGCGRGELVELLAQDGLRVLGVDLNDIQLEEARRHGCPVLHADALDYLQGLESGSVLAVFAIHVVEHIPFPALVRLMQEIARVLTRGGLVLFETPNPRNLIVGATTFHFDPTHIRPLPPEVLQVLLETVGFGQVETRPLHPSETLDYMVRHHGLDRHVANLLYGPQDYAALGVMA